MTKPVACRAWCHTPEHSQDCLCAGCSQNVSAVEGVPLVLALPPGVGAIDFYIDLAIDCVNTTDVTRPCQARKPPLRLPGRLS